MVNQIPVPQAKYELLSDVRQTRWRNQVLCLALTFVVVGSFFVTFAWFDILTAKAPSDSPLLFPESRFRDAKIAPWLRRARMYAESTKENQNADRNSTIAKGEQFGSRATSQIVVCYYTIPGDLNSSWELGPSHIDPRICTHIIVGFASVVNSTISLGDASWIYEKVASLKSREPKLKVMLSAGGMDELREGFPEMVKTHATRKRFIKSVLNVTKSLNLDGLDVDWEFPVWMGAHEREKIYFVQLLQETRRAFDRSGRKLLLSVAVASVVAIVDQSYNVPEIAEHVDFVNLMSYDYHLYVWYFPITGLNAPLYPRGSDSGYLATLNTNYSAMYWLAKGLPREKLVVGIPTYGHSFELVNPQNHNLLAPTKGFGKLGTEGFVSYSLTCSFLQIGATRHFDQDSRVPYAFKFNEWVSYDDRDSVLQKAEWIKANGFGGAMIFSLNDDDWNSTCNGTDGNSGNETFPLARTVARVLRDTSVKRVSRASRS